MALAWGLEFDWRCEMKRFLLGMVVMAGMAGGTATAADMSVPFKSAPAVQHSYNWTGCYIGINAGGIGSHSDFSTWGAGALVGGQLGCNYQIDHFVVGIEGGGGWSGLSMDLNNSTPTTSSSISTKTQWDADIAMRLGLAFDRFLIYTKTGIVWLNNDYRNATSSTFGPSSSLTTASQTLPGFLMGLGVEYGITAQWTARVEVDLAFLDATNVNFVCSGTPFACGSPTATISESQWAFMGKVGANYRF
jgi:outer membrane immunogenic protein